MRDTMTMKEPAAAYHVTPASSYLQSSCLGLHAFGWLCMRPQPMQQMLRDGK
jgi:hypothetical protein